MGLVQGWHREVDGEQGLVRELVRWSDGEDLLMDWTWDEEEEGDTEDSKISACKTCWMVGPFVVQGTVRAIRFEVDIYNNGFEYIVRYHLDS